MTDLEAICTGVYEDTRKLPQLTANPALGFEILMGPPLKRPPIVFIGYQPGNGSLSVEQARQAGYEQEWPKTNEYLTASWPLAKRMRRMFGVELLQQCVGLNAIFVRSRSAHTYVRSLSRHDRRAVRAFCLEEVGKLVRAMDPRLVVVIGFSTLELFGAGTADLRNHSGRVLTRFGEVHGRRAIATLHLTGSQIANADIDRIASQVKQYLMNA